MSEQLSFDAMPRPLFACTPSRLAAFDCPRYYRFTYLDRPSPPRGPAWARATVGAVAHVALQRWWSLPRSQRIPELGIELVERNWAGYGFRDDRQSAATCELVGDWVGAYLREHVRASDEPVGVECTVAARTSRLALSGRIDRLDDRLDDRPTADGDGRLVVVDYKTSLRPPTSTDAANSRALALYAIAVEATLHRPCRRVELHHLPTGTIAAHDHTDASLAAALDDAEQRAHAIETAHDHPPVPGPGCSWCDFRRSCSEGRAASEEKPSWAGLPAEVG